MRHHLLLSNGPRPVPGKGGAGVVPLQKRRQFGEGVFDLSGGAKSRAYHSLARAFDIADHVLYPAREICRTVPMNLALQRQLDVRETGVAEQPEQAPPDSAVAAESLLKSLERSPHVFERAAWRVDAEQTGVVFTCGRAPARPRHAPHLAQYLLRLRHMFQQKPRIYKIETAVWKIQMLRIAFHIGQDRKSVV